MGLSSDARLSRLAAEGSTAAFAAIYRRYHQPLSRYCRSILGNEHEAADALQSAMVRALHALDDEDREIALRPWLFRIAHNEAITILRKRRPEESLERASSAVAREVDFEARQRLRDLIVDLDRLAPRQRSALVMRELNGLEFDEIAAALETSPTAVKTTVYEARLALQDFEAGREMTCDEARRKISDDDRRVLRGRAMRAHLADCSDCSGFAAALRGRRRDLGAIAAPLPAPAAAALLTRVLEGAGVAGSATLAGGGTAILSAGVVKVSIAGLLAAGVTTAGLELDRGDDRSPPPAPSAKEAPASPAKPAAGPAGETLTDRVEDRPGPDQAGGGVGGENSAGAGGENGGGAGGGGGDSGSAHGGASGGPTIPGTPPATAPTTGPGHGGTPPGHGGAPPGQAQTPPGQSQTPPGLAQTPPGQANGGGSDTPPSQAQNSPGQAQTLPGHAQTPAGQVQTPPVPSQTPPGQSQTPAGQAGTPPGEDG